MKLAKLETLHTDDGPVGLGETSFAAESVESYLHELVAPRARVRVSPA